MDMNISNVFSQQSDFIKTQRTGLDHQSFKLFFFFNVVNLIRLVNFRIHRQKLYELTLIHFFVGSLMLKIDYVPS